MNTLPSFSQAFSNGGLVNTADLTDGKASFDASGYNRHYEPSFRGHQVEACQTAMGPLKLSSSPKSSSSHCENNNKTQGNNSFLSFLLDDVKSPEQLLSTEGFFDVNNVIEPQSASDTQLISSGYAAEIERGHWGIDKLFDVGGQLKPTEHQLEMRRVDQSEASESVFLRCQPPSASYHSTESDKELHTSGKHFQSEVCPERFTTQNSLNVHYLTHTSEKPFQCEQCSASFALKSGLKIHSRTHTGEKPYKCEQCSASFAVKYNLRIHLRAHTGEKPYKCEQCSASFAVKYNLRVHLRTHTGEKPYKCAWCSNSYTSNQSLQSHLRKHHTADKPSDVFRC